MENDQKKLENKSSIKTEKNIKLQLIEEENLDENQLELEEAQEK